MTGRFKSICKLEADEFDLVNQLGRTLPNRKALDGILLTGVAATTLLRQSRNPNLLLSSADAYTYYPSGSIGWAYCYDFKSPNFW